LQRAQCSDFNSEAVHMTSPTTVRIQRTGDHRFTATNNRGAEVAIGRAGQENSFSPTELLLVAIGACSHVTAESVLTRRIGDAAPQGVTVEGTEDTEHRYPSVRVSFDVDLSGLDERTDVAAAALRAIERLCTVSRTVKHGAEVTVELDGTTLAVHS
jgi:uncharacterized OsmC-like protein